LPEGASRHDGWDGERMAKFCEVLAETGLVADACLAAGKSRGGAYSLRQRDCVFVAAWDAALGLARSQLADALLARSLEGSIEHYYRDGELVGEKRYFDNRLGLAVLRRLDKQADEAREKNALPALLGGEWETALAALRSGGSRELGALLAKVRADAEGNEVDKVDTPSESFSDAEADEAEDAPQRVWKNAFGDWCTDFPPPDDFDGVDRGEWDDLDYERPCTNTEIEIIERSLELDRVDRLTADESERNSYFAQLAAKPEEDADATRQPDSSE
jgi:hypothetical protein